LSRKAKFFTALLVIAALFFVFITLRVVVLKPQSSMKLAKISAGEYDPAIWGKSYPLEYKTYQKNLEMDPSPTGYGDSRKIQHSIKEPEILTNFKGMAFSKDYAEDRGHPYSIQDLKETKRINPNTPGACMTCKTANLIDIYKDMGWTYAKTPLTQLFPKMKHPVVCANCHDPATMNLRVINPAFIEAMQRKGIDVKKAPREQMRSYVCGQCHVEYYFEPETSRVIFPWDKGLLPEQMYAYYSEKPGGFTEDWLHPDSKARMLKAQHPDFETWSNGVHGKAGVSCADCHMPFMRENGQKYTSHWVTSPMKHIKSACMTCHTEGEAWLLERVKTTQNSVWQLQRIAGTVVARAHEAIGKAEAAAKANQKELDRAREFVRKAQWFWDIVAAENSMGFHNPPQTLNTLGQSIDLAHQAISTANHAVNASN
jgi:nitrite reductase (cytochrome c-552)